MVNGQSRLSGGSRRGRTAASPMDIDVDGDFIDKDLT